MMSASGAKQEELALPSTRVIELRHSHAVGKTMVRLWNTIGVRGREMLVWCKVGREMLVWCKVPRSRTQ